MNFHWTLSNTFMFLKFQAPQYRAQHSRYFQQCWEWKDCICLPAGSALVIISRDSISSSLWLGHVVGLCSACGSTRTYKSFSAKLTSQVALHFHLSSSMRFFPSYLSRLPRSLFYEMLKITDVIWYFSSVSDLLLNVRLLLSFILNVFRVQY